MDAVDDVGTAAWGADGAAGEVLLDLKFVQANPSYVVMTSSSPKSSKLIGPRLTKISVALLVLLLLRLEDLIELVLLLLPLEDLIELVLLLLSLEDLIEGAVIELDVAVDDVLVDFRVEAFEDFDDFRLRPPSTVSLKMATRRRRNIIAERFLVSMVKEREGTRLICQDLMQVCRRRLLL
jgi:hypothetical protein